MIRLFLTIFLFLCIQSKANSIITYKEILDNPLGLELNLNYAKQQEEAGNIKNYWSPFGTVDFSYLDGNYERYHENGQLMVSGEFKEGTLLAPYKVYYDDGSVYLEKNSKGWSFWQNNLAKTLKAGNIFGSEGLAINMSVYIDDLETEFLPLNCNWLTSNLLPKYDEQQKTFVEPYLPNYKIGIMHLAAGIWKDGKDMRVDKNIKIEIETLDNNKILKSLRYNN